MAYNDKPHAASYGERYPAGEADLAGIDSKWKRIVEIDHDAGTLWIEIGGDRICCDPANAEWLEDALRTVRFATAPIKENK